MFSRINIIPRYIGKIYFYNLLAIIAIFVLLFALVDTFNTGKINNNIGIGISLLESMIQLDALFPFITCIATIAALLKFKQTSQDIAFISIGIDLHKILQIMARIAIILYLIYCIFIHTFAFYALKNFENSRTINRSCIGEIVSKKDQKNLILLEKIKYNLCNQNYLTSDVELQINSVTNNINVIFSNNHELYSHNVLTNEIVKLNKPIRSYEEIKEMDKIDKHRNDISSNKAPIYYVISSIIKDDAGILHNSDLIQVILNKTKNILMIYVYTYMCYFIIIANKRSFNVSKRIVNILFVMIIYYIFTYILCEKVKDVNNIIIQLVCYIVMHIFVILALRHIQHKCFLSIDDLFKEMRYIKILAKKYLYFIDKLKT